MPVAIKLAFSNEVEFQESKVVQSMMNLAEEGVWNSGKSVGALIDIPWWSDKRFSS